MQTFINILSKSIIVFDVKRNFTQQSRSALTLTQSKAYLVWISFVSLYHMSDREATASTGLTNAKGQASVLIRFMNFLKSGDWTLTTLFEYDVRTSPFSMGSVSRWNSGIVGFDSEAWWYYIGYATCSVLDLCLSGNDGNLAKKFLFIFHK